MIGEAIVVEGAVKSLSNLLGEGLKLFVEEVIFLRDVPSKIEWIKEQLEFIKCFLEDASAKSRKGDKIAKLWVNKIRGVSYQIEDLVDDIEDHIEEKRRRRMEKWIPRIIGKPSELIVLHKIGIDIENIKSKITNISRSRDSYEAKFPTENQNDSSLIQDRMDSERFVNPYFQDQTKLVGFENYSKRIVGLLIDPKRKDRSVISIVGMAGLGKTSLAKKVYDASEIKDNFHVFSWVVVSQKYTIIGLLTSILNDLSGSSNTNYTCNEQENTNYTNNDRHDKMHEIKLIERIHKILKRGKYLVVLDDLWTLESWNDICRIFPNTNNGSRILLTTRNIEVANHVDPLPQPVELQVLNEEDSWKLLKNTIFSNTESCSYDAIIGQLEPIGQTLAKKCQGLPLALVVLGGLLRENIDYLSWLKLVERMDWGSTASGQRCLDILALSYEQLPNIYVKSCFLYVASFPEDSLISASKLVQLWIAEGLIPQTFNYTLEETAEIYLKKLIQNCLVQIARRIGTTGRVKKIRMHDILRDWCMEKARMSRFFSNIKDSPDSDVLATISHDTKRLFFQFGYDRLIDKLAESLCYPRTIVGLVLHDKLKPESYDQLHLLRVLDLRNPEMFCNLNIEELELCKMRHLRYVGWKANLDSVEVPNLRGYFSNSLLHLQTFDARGVYLSKFPGEFWNIQTLRNVYLRCNLEPIVTTSVTENLYKLHIQLYSGSGCIWQEYGYEPLRQLLTRQNKLVFLTIQVHKYRVTFDVGLVPLQILSCFKNLVCLRFLKLKGRLEHARLPRCTEFPPNLAELTLIYSQLKEDPMPILERLPNLVFLRLENHAYEGHDMHCRAGGFPRLQHLQLDGTCNLQKWIAEEGTMPNLSNLAIRRPRKMLPDALCNLRCLKELHLSIFEGDSRWLVDGMKKEGADWYKIQHISYVNVIKLSTPDSFYTNEVSTYQFQISGMLACIYY